MEWTEILEQYGSLVWKTVTRLVPEANDAADCFQRTFVSAWQLSLKERVDNWPALLRWMATARALERRREIARHRARHGEFPEDGVIDRRSGDPASDAATIELEQSLREALANLDAREAEVFCLACLEGMAYQEIATRIGLSANHVGVLLHRARTGLRIELMRFHSLPQPHVAEDAP